MRQILNFRMYARERPQRLQRLYFRTLNFGVACDLMTRHFLAMVYLDLEKGMPSFSSISRASASLCALVTMVISIPC